MLLPLRDHRVVDVEPVVAIALWPSHFDSNAQRSPRRWAQRSPRRWIAERGEHRRNRFSCGGAHLSTVRRFVLLRGCFREVETLSI